MGLRGETAYSGPVACDRSYAQRVIRGGESPRLHATGGLIFV
jgi:hypothetical protein